MICKHCHNTYDTFTICRVNGVHVIDPAWTPSFTHDRSTNTPEQAARFEARRNA